MDPITNKLGPVPDPVFFFFSEGSLECGCGRVCQRKLAVRRGYGLERGTPLVRCLGGFGWSLGVHVHAQKKVLCIVGNMDGRPRTPHENLRTPRSRRPPRTPRNRIIFWTQDGGGSPLYRMESERK